MLSSVRLASASVTILLASTTSSFAVTAPSPVALSGAIAPGGSGGTYVAFTNPVLNANGQVAFQASLTGGTSTGGVFTGLSGLLQAVALQNTAAPNGELYGTLYTSATTVTVNLNNSGQLAFISPLTGGTPTSGIFTGTSAGTLQLVALQSNAAPAGGNYLAFAATGINAASSPVINPNGQVAFSSTLTGGSPSPGAGIFVGTPGTLQTVALLGGATPAGGVYTTALTAPVLNNNGQVAFVSLLGTSSPQVLFAGAPGSLQSVMVQATTAPGTGGQLYGTPNSISYNDAGKISYTSSLTGGASTSGVFAGTPGNIQPVVLNNTVAAGGSGGTYTSISNATVNKLGQVGFTSTLTGGTAASGLFQTTLGGTVRAVALAGDVDPDGSGATIASFSSGEVQNGVGMVTFIANLTGAGVTSGTNSVALLAGLPGFLVQIVRQGDIIDVNADPLITDSRTVSVIGLLINAGGQDGKGVNFNDSAVIAYRLGFTDGSAGIFTSVVPEPATLSLLALGGMSLLRRRTTAK
ncbi:MAG: hypothetical protein JWM57_4403 [Phycisphaerales bacterium]|nr:hypothetical protein [Phycisphaerales bacterium]